MGTSVAVGAVLRRFDGCHCCRSIGSEQPSLCVLRIRIATALRRMRHITLKDLKRRADILIKVTWHMNE